MPLDDLYVFFFSALGVFDSLLLSIYFLLFAKPQKASNYFLGGLLVVMSIRIWKSLFFYFNPELSEVYLQIGLTACFFIGPFLYYFVKSKQVTATQKARQWYFQLLFLFGLVITVGLVYPYPSYPEFWGNHFYKIINYLWLFFIVISGFEMKGVFKKVFSAKRLISYDDVWLLSVYAGVSIIWLAYFTASYTSYILGAISFSFVLYLSALLIFYKKRERFEWSSKKEKYARNKISEEEAEVLLKKVQDVFNEKALYKNPNFTLAQMAKELNTRPHVLSQFLNDNVRKSFSQFINEYRIEEAKKLLEVDSHLKMEVIADSCGFNSNSTFYAAFKKVTGTTPAKYTKI